MLEITPEQMSSMDADARRAFVRRLAAFLRRQVPSLADEPGPIEPEVERQIVKAVGHGLEGENAVSAYVLAAAWLGPDFDVAFPAAAAVLAANDMSETQKADWLDGWTVEMFERLERG